VAEVVCEGDLVGYLLGVQLGAAPAVAGLSRSPPAAHKQVNNAFPTRLDPSYFLADETTSSSRLSGWRASSTSRVTGRLCVDPLTLHSYRSCCAMSAPEREGALFEGMRRSIEPIASLTGMSE